MKKVISNTFTLTRSARVGPFRNGRNPVKKKRTKVSTVLGALEILALLSAAIPAVSQNGSHGGGSPPRPTPWVSVRQFGARGTARVTRDGTMEKGSPLLVSQSSSFTADDRKKPVYILAAGRNGAPLSTTITSILSRARALLAAPAEMAVHDTAVTIGFDDATSIQNAITSVGEAGGGTVYIPAGFYRVAAGLQIPYSHVRLTGDGPTSLLFESDLVSYPTSEALAGGWSPHRLIDVGVKNGIVRDIQIDHLQVQTNGDKWIQHSLGQSLIETAPTADYQVEDFNLNAVTFTSTNFGLYSNGGRLAGFHISDNVMSEVAKEGIYLAGTPTNGAITHNQISSTIHPSVSNIGIEIKNGRGLEIESNIIKGSFYACIASNRFPESDITIERNECFFSDSPNVGDGIGFDHGKNISVIGNLIAGYRAYGITFRGSTTAIAGIKITGNTVQNGKGGAAISIVATPADPLNGPADVTVSNNTLIDNVSNGGIIELANITGNNTVTDNKIRAGAPRHGNALVIMTRPEATLTCHGNTIVNYPRGQAPCQ